MGHADKSHTLCCLYRLLHCLHTFCLDLLVLHLQTSCGKKAMGGPTFNLINREGQTQVADQSHTLCCVFCLHILLHCLHNFCLDLLVLHLHFTLTICGKTNS